MKVTALKLSSGRTRKNWTQEEDDLLAEYYAQAMSVEQIAKLLNRGCASVAHRITKLHYTREFKDNYYTTEDIAKICGIDDSTVNRHILSGLLEASRPVDFYVVTPEALKKYLVKQRYILNRCCVDLAAIIEVLSEPDMRQF